MPLNYSVSAASEKKPTHPQDESPRRSSVEEQPEEEGYLKKNNSIATLSPKQHKVMIMDQLSKKRGSVALQQPK